MSMFKYHPSFYWLLTFFFVASVPQKAVGISSQEQKKIVLMAGKKTHPAAMHEYIKTVRLLKVMLDNATNLEGITTEIHLNGWPDDPAALDDADLVMTISDGQDGPTGIPVPFMTDERMQVMEKLMQQGCGFITYHFSTFAPDDYGEKILDWGGGYFDWQNEQGEREWYSAIKYMDVTVELPSPDHPIVSGVQPFKVLEEYYYNMRFQENDTRWKPIINVKELESADRKNGGVVAWTVEREDGGRGFGTTMGHFYANWKDENYRRLMLNAIVWAAGAAVPEGGVDTQFYTDREVTQLLYGKSVKSLILTGNHHPAHLWEETTPVIKNAIEQDDRILVDVSTDITDVFQYDLQDYDFLVMNYCNWEDPAALNDRQKQALLQYVENGGGLLFIHFANGAFHYSLPDAGSSDWPAYRALCRRVWDHDADSGHDAYGTFTVKPTEVSHEITEGTTSFTTTDELYYNQKGEEEIQVLLTATSKDTGNEEPMAWIYEIDNENASKSRVFQTVLGHDVAALRTPEVQTMIRRAAAWVAEGTQMWNDL